MNNTIAIEIKSNNISISNIISISFVDHGMNVYALNVFLIC